MLAAPPNAAAASTAAIRTSGGWPPGQPSSAARPVADRERDAAGERAAQVRAAADEHPEQRRRDAEGHHRAGEQRRRRRRGARPWSSTRYGNAHSPVSVTNGAIEREVHPQAVAGRRATRQARLSAGMIGGVRGVRPSGCGRRGRSRGRLRRVGAVLDPADGQQRQRGGQDPAGGEGRRPADAGQRRAQSGAVREQLAERAARRGQRGGEGVAAGREPVRGDPQDVEEHAGVAGADQRAPERSPSASDGLNANSSSPDAHRQQPERQRPPRPEPVRQQPRRDLHRQVHAQLHRRQQRDRARRHPEPLRSRPATPRRGSSDGRSPPDRRPPPTPTSAKPQSCTRIVSNMYA